MKAMGILFFILMFVHLAPAQLLIVDGTQESQIHYRMEQNVEPFPGIDVLMVSFVVPRDFHSPTYSQKITNVTFDFSPAAEQQEEETDSRGNTIRKFYWDKPGQSVRGIVTFTANNQVKLLSLESEAPFPPAGLPAEVNIFLTPTEQVQSDNPQIIAKAQELTRGASSQFAAVQSVLNFVVDHMRYVLVPEKYDALYAFRSGRGNCQNYSHLAAALMRAVGIPVRIVNGITLKRAYDVKVGAAEYSFEMAQGRHSWIEVFFSDLGWIPFDPQQTEFFVSNRYVRIEVGLDNEETVQDGLVRWSQTRGSGEQMPKLEEAIESNFVFDRVDLRSQEKIAGPRNLLLSPRLVSARPPLAAEEPPVAAEPLPEEPQPEPEKPVEEEIDYTALKYEIPFEYGNLEFPRNFDFLYARLMGGESSGEKGMLKRNFMVETAEYVTSKTQYAQAFVLKEPILLKKIGLALHNFGGSGLVWLELSEDVEGKPGPMAAKSRTLATHVLHRSKGYDWVDFDFSSEGLVLSPGRYWFTLKYSGSPIINWFYSYGKPVGPVDGTRSLTPGGWDRILNYEFNYRVLGLAAKP
ncbi:MAG: transglutaminase-like domain-containing protein [Calditrichia bacterium]